MRSIALAAACGIVLACASSAEGQSLSGELQDANLGDNYHIYSFTPWDSPVGSVTALYINVAWAQGPPSDPSGAPPYVTVAVLCPADAEAPQAATFGSDRFITLSLGVFVVGECEAFLASYGAPINYSININAHEPALARTGSGRANLRHPLISRFAARGR